MKNSDISIAVWQHSILLNNTCVTKDRKSLVRFLSIELDIYLPLWPLYRGGDLRYPYIWPGWGRQAHRRTKSGQYFTDVKVAKWYNCSLLLLRISILGPMPIFDLKRNKLLAKKWRPGWKIKKQLFSKRRTEDLRMSLKHCTMQQIQGGNKNRCSAV